ncbi:hypothetical protein PF010_g32762 [Phytophthora fragariae]|uniref:Uncharacterized protein n=1 Tax=Phytophthora fragariae TaxID=53985 RepID=A0A6G0JE25_9STRA|nr:hypothetical protein PF010_g32762 [Phytophthora fragariae]
MFTPSRARTTIEVSLLVPLLTMRVPLSPPSSSRFRPSSVVCTTSCLECVGSPFYIFVASTSAPNSTTPTQANSTHATFLLV